MVTYSVHSGIGKTRIYQSIVAKRKAGRFRNCRRAAVRSIVARHFELADQAVISELAQLKISLEVYGHKFPCHVI